MHYSVNLAFHFIEALALYLFFMFKTREHVNNQTVHIWIFIFLVSPHFSKVIKYAFTYLKSFGISSILTLSINVRLKVTRVFCILRVLLIKLCIERNILLLLIMSKILVILYCSFKGLQLEMRLFFLIL